MTNAGSAVRWRSFCGLAIGGTLQMRWLGDDPIRRIAVTG
jgi:hypothetical protein